jgi:hypothetical protein
LAFKPGEDIDDFVLHLNSLQQQLARFSDTSIDKERVVEKLLHVVPKKYMQLALSIETLLDFTELTIEEVMGCLKAVDNRELPQSRSPSVASFSSPRSSGSPASASGRRERP